MGFYCYNDEVTRNNVSLLSYFKSLTHLSIENAHDTGVTMFDVLASCQNLKTLSFLSPDIPAPIDESQALVNLIPDSKYNKRLESLTISVPSLTLPYIKYLNSQRYGRY
jgi:hypothetical protein